MLLLITLISESKFGLLHGRRSDLLELKEKGAFVGVMLRKEEGAVGWGPLLWTLYQKCGPASLSARVFHWWFTNEQTWVFSDWPVPLRSVCACPYWLWICSGNGPLSCICLHISCSSSLQIEAGLDCLGRLYRRPKDFFFLCVLRKHLRPCSSLKGIANSM